MKNLPPGGDPILNQGRNVKVKMAAAAGKTLLRSSRTSNVWAGWLLFRVLIWMRKILLELQ